MQSGKFTILEHFLSQENAFSSSGTEYTDAACTITDDTYSSSGAFVVGKSLTTSSGVSSKEINITFSNNGYTLYDIFRLDGDRLYNRDTGGLDYEEH